jgi:hypothetical protein
MEFKSWSPNILGDLFCDRDDYLGLYYWFDLVMEKKKFSRLKKGESMEVTFEHL